MTEPELFDVIELLVDLPEYNLRSGVQGAIAQLSKEVETLKNSKRQSKAPAFVPISHEARRIKLSSFTKKALSDDENVMVFLREHSK